MSDNKKARVNSNLQRFKYEVAQEMGLSHREQLAKNSKKITQQESIKDSLKAHNKNAE